MLRIVVGGRPSVIEGGSLHMYIVVYKYIEYVHDIGVYVQYSLVKENIC